MVTSAYDKGTSAYHKGTSKWHKGTSAYAKGTSKFDKGMSKIQLARKRREAEDRLRVDPKQNQDVRLVMGEIIFRWVNSFDDL